MEAVPSSSAPNAFHRRLIPFVRGVVRLLEPAVFPGSEPGPPLAQRAPADADPIIIIPGVGDSSFGSQDLANALRRDGFTVFTPDMPQSGLVDAIDSARYLRAYVELVKQRTGHDHVNIVAHSQGGLIARSYIRWLGGAGSVDSLTTLGTPNDGLESYLGFSAAAMGTRLVQALLPPGITQMRTGGEFIRALNAGDPTPGDVRYTSIFARGYDDVVTPRSARLEGATNVVLVQGRGGRGPSHFSINHTSDEAYLAVRNALLGAQLRAAARKRRASASAASTPRHISSRAASALR